MNSLLEGSTYRLNPLTWPWQLLQIFMNAKADVSSLSNVTHPFRQWEQRRGKIPRQASGNCCLLDIVPKKGSHDYSEQQQVPVLYSFPGPIACLLEKQTGTFQSTGQSRKPHKPRWQRLWRWRWRDSQPWLYLSSVSHSYFKEVFPQHTHLDLWMSSKSRNSVLAH